MCNVAERVAGSFHPDTLNNGCFPYPTLLLQFTLVRWGLKPNSRNVGLIFAVFLQNRNLQCEDVQAQHSLAKPYIQILMYRIQSDQGPCRGRVGAYERDRYNKRHVSPIPMLGKYIGPQAMPTLQLSGYVGTHLYISILTHSYIQGKN